jgi:hypothetical protein
MMDTGAPESCSGADYLDAFASAHQLQLGWLPFQNRLSGIGSGFVPVSHKNTVPIGLVPQHDKSGFVNGRWTCQRLEGVGKSVPPLYGLAPMLSRRVLYDFRNPKQPVMSMLRHSAGSHDDRIVLELAIQHGHLLLPIDWGGKSLDKSARVPRNSEPNVFYSDSVLPSSESNLLDFSALQSFQFVGMLHDFTYLSTLPGPVASDDPQIHSLAVYSGAIATSALATHSLPDSLSHITLDIAPPPGLGDSVLVVEPQLPKENVMGEISADFD